MNELFIRPACTQSSDEVFLTASNQIVNDLRSTHPAFPYRMRLAGLETCSVAQGLFTSAFFSNPGEPENFADFDQNFGRLLSADFNQVNKRLKTWQPLPSFSFIDPIEGACELDRRSRPQNY